MGEKETTKVATSATTTTTTTTNKLPSHVARKKRGALHLIRVALYMLRRGPEGKSKSVEVDVATEGQWKRLVGGMRPLHLQHHQSPIAGGPTIMATPQVDQLLPTPMSPQQPFSPSCSSCDDSASRYASAQNLQELDRSDHEIEDEMIDARAEEFIARFYEQMKLQRLDSFNRYNQMMERGSR